MVKRIVPCLDTREGKLVKGVNFENIEELGDPVEYAKKYDEEGADELVFLDIVATPENRPTFLEVVEKISDQIDIPLIVGGGIRSVEDAKNALEAGADKISVNTAAVKNPDLITSLAEKFGSEKVVIAIDAKKSSDENWEVYVSGGKESTGLDLFDWAKQVEEQGAGEILFTGKHTDGTKDGYDLEGTRKLAEELDIPIIASGGAGNMEHIKEALVEGKADAALAASIFHYGEYTVSEVKEYLDEEGVSVRI